MAETAKFAKNGLSPHNDAQQIAALERLQEVLELRKRGYSYAEIGAYYKITRQRAFQLVKKAMSIIENELHESAEDVRTLELERLDKMFQKLWADAMPSQAGVPVDHKKIETMLKVMDRRAKLMGLDAAQKHEIMSIDQIDSQIAALEKEISTRAAVAGDPVPQE